MEQYLQQIQVLIQSNEEYEMQQEASNKQINDLKQIQIKLLYNLDTAQKEKAELEL